MLIDLLSGAIVYTALKLPLGYNQLRINPDDTHKTTFKTQFGRFEWLVIVPFGLTSASFSYQRLMNYILQPHKNTFILVYRDDMLLFGKPLNDHIRHLDKTLSLLASHDIRL
jgi:hypothetical protein